VLDANSAGLDDEDAEVRALCLHNIQFAAEALDDLIERAISPTRFPPEGRKLSDDERKFIPAMHEDIAAELKQFSPVLTGVRNQGPLIMRRLEDPDSRARLAAVTALETIGNARLRLKKRVLSVPVVTPAETGGDRGNREALAANDMLELFVHGNLGPIGKLLTDPDVKLRRKAVEFLDIIEDAATPALPWLTTSLRDSDKYVRWSASRAIANIAPDKAASAVPGLAHLLADPDLGVRIQAAKTLKEMGVLAQGAAPALAGAVANGDAEARLAAMEALQAIGPEKGKIAVAQLIGALSHADPRVRRGAARTLGSFGAAALPAVNALRQALGDEDQSVRAHASDAILDIVK
jgi:HEAT repeat protein